MNAIQLLKRDHAEVRDLLQQLVKTTNRANQKRQELLAKIEREILVHTQLEEQLFYPAFRESGAQEHAKLFFEALEEHRAVGELILPDLKATEPTSDQFAGRAKVLHELIDHHATEEEETIFPLAERTMSKEFLKDLGEQMEALKEELLQSEILFPQRPAVPLSRNSGASLPRN